MIYAGAGISLSSPTNLPSGAALAAAIHGQLKAVFSDLEAVNGWDLVAVADAAVARPGGEDALRQVAAKSANFRSARVGYAHKALAHLMLEGAIDVLTTNWDTCIERAAGEEGLPTVTSEHDLAEVHPPWVLKLHGCASRPNSLLLTSDHLDSPPKWVQDQTHARLGSAIVVFIGIGDVAGYVKKRIEEAISEVGAENIRVVGPGIDTGWEDSQWHNVAPTMREEHKISATADLFMEQLAAAYVLTRLQEHIINMSSDDTLSAYLEAGRSSLLNCDSLSVLQWARSIDINPRVGESVMKSTELGRALIALGRVGGDSAQLTRMHTFETSQGHIEVLIATQGVPTRRLVERAEYRLHEHHSRGEPLPVFIVAGGIGPVPRSRELPDSIFGEVDETDILNASIALVPDIMLADEVIAS